MRKDVIFWNVDTQVDFVNANGKLPVPNAEEIKPALSHLTKFAKDNNIQVVNTCDWHDEDTEEISKEPDFLETFPEHCMKDTVGATFVPETNPTDSILVFNPKLEVPHRDDVDNFRNFVIRKDKFDVFAGSKAASRLVNYLPHKKYVVYGVAENVCVNFAVKGLLEKGKEVYVVSDAIKGLEGIESPISEWEKSGVKIISLNKINEILNLQNA